MQLTVYKKKKTSKPRKVRRSRQYRTRRPTSTSQVFSETYKVGEECLGVNSAGEVFIPAGSSGQGIKLLTQMNKVPQVGSYKDLWNSYKIIKAKFTIIPKWGPETFNEAALATLAAAPLKETTRFAYAVNDNDDNLVPPSSELEVLQDNGCRVKMFTRPLNITIRPKPLLEQQTSIGFTHVFQNRGQWIEFDDIGPAVQHVGLDGYFTAVNNLTDGFASIADV